MSIRDKEWRNLVGLSPEQQRTRDSIDEASRLSGYGELSRAYTNTLMGFDHQYSGVPVPANFESRGMIFFTRPRMNLSYDNIIRDRLLTFLASNDKNSMARAIRCWLDPIYSAEALGSNLMDHKSPFIPLLSNSLISMGGWPDIVAEFYSSDPGIAKENFFYYDGPKRFYGEFPLTCTWRNMPGDPITSLLHVWLTYGLNVMSGNMLPYPEAIIEREIDYNTRIYHFVLDPSRRFVQKFAACGAAVPQSAGIAASFNFSSDSPYTQDSMRQVSLPFHCVGAEYNDPITIDEFNRLQARFNPDMRTLDSRQRKMTKLTPDTAKSMNHYGYPFINPYTYEFEWWVYNHDFGSAPAPNPPSEATWDGTTSWGRSGETLPAP